MEGKTIKLRRRPKNNNAIRFEEVSISNAQWEPFGATVYMPNGKPLSLMEKSMIDEALENVAHRICESRGLELGAPFW